MSDEIFLRDLRIDTIIGIYDWEREEKQTISVDLKMPADIRKAAQRDHIDATLNYKKVAKRVVRFVEASSYQLVETLAQDLADLILNEFDLDWVEINVNKPGAIRGAKDVGVHIMRGLDRCAGGRSVYVSLGSNIEPRKNLNGAMAALSERFGPLSRSTVYRNKAVGFEGDDFLNLVAGFRSDESISEVLAALRDVELLFGRRHGDKTFAARTLDLDLLLFGDAIINRDGINVPRAELAKYAFMLKPLAELAGDVRDPVSGRPYAMVWQDAGLHEHVMTPVSLDD